ncbi:MAG: CRISPR-associated helicase Cas3' [Bacteroidales bacterium]|nr:CRISPR-associated helicase Cas3' [Bacteroidales bacterium]
MTIVCEHIKAKGKPDYTPLVTHLEQVTLVVEKVAEELSMDVCIAKQGAILHDIGKTSPIFQRRLYSKDNSNKVYRHEIGSIFFLSLFSEEIHSELIEMVIAHHKSIYNDARERGILDLNNLYGDGIIEYHLTDWENWSKTANKILQSFGIKTREISKDEAISNYKKTFEYCKSEKRKFNGYSEWRGLMNAADYFASALENATTKNLKRIFKKPDLSFFNRTHPLYPLSLKQTTSKKRHTIVVAPTGAGKTDFLFRRTKNRVFYTLPFQASINAMYKRVGNDLKKDNPDLDIRLLHASSKVIAGKNKEEKVLQGLIGSSIKILTPHQIAAVVFGTRGYESILLDLKGNDVILDEIHTYDGVSRAIVLKIVEVLNDIGCNIHIGTATMPSDLYAKIINLLGKENVYEVKLKDEDLEKFNRHITHKLDNWEDAQAVISSAVAGKEKVLIVANRVKKAQDWYSELKENYPNIPILLLHSRFKRGDRNKKEIELLGLDENGNSLNKFNTSDKACIVVSTQVVEVSIDISFDVMITETAPLDSMIQRFGRVNRKRNNKTIGKFKPVYILKPTEDSKEALPYKVDILKRSYDILPNGEILRETELQQKIDAVFPKIDLMNIETHAVFKNTKEWKIDKLTHRQKSILLDLLEIDSVACILESEQEKYINTNYEERMMMEIPARYWQVKDLFQLKGYGNNPFIVPDNSYSEETGFNVDKARQGKYNIENSFL